jgi:hypothetical protein
MRASSRDREVFRHIAEAESDPRPAPASFIEALRALDRLLARHQRMFPSYRPEPDEEEFRAHQALYERARELDARHR